MYPAKPEDPTDTAHAFQVLETQHSALEVGTFRSEDTPQIWGLLLSLFRRQALSSSCPCSCWNGSFKGDPDFCGLNVREASNFLGSGAPGSSSCVSFACRRRRSDAFQGWLREDLATGLLLGGFAHRIRFLGSLAMSILSGILLSTTLFSPG